MLTNPATRKRYDNNPPPTTALLAPGIITPGLSQITAADMALIDPISAEVTEQMSAIQGFYRFHQGDIFLPGPAAFAMDPSHDTPLHTVWGHAFLVRANAFRPLAIGQIAFSAPVQPLVGVGGPIAGQMAFQPLTVRQADGG